MMRRRWYPSAQLLGRAAGTGWSAGSRVIVSGGSSYENCELYGGRAAGGSTLSGEIERFQLTENGGWDNTSTPSQQIPHQTGGSLPVARAGHTQAWNNGSALSMVFGGQIANLTYKQELWLLRHAGNATDNDFVYEWENATPDPSFSPSPDPRSQHTAVVMADYSMIVYGGIGHPGSNDVVLDDGVWRLSPGAPWTWTHLSTTSSELPGPRQGHTAIYDQPHNRVLVFGGASTTAANPTLADNEVWSLKVDTTVAPPQAVWSKIPLRSGSGRPAARTEHVMVYDGGDRGGASSRCAQAVVGRRRAPNM
ncbi:MAG: hypothetical protein HY216_06545 [Candidatus Rokubacteria bacterium]|nr:hypothetical protein [Candidatus Rokubacteria bacterium]